MIHQKLTYRDLDSENDLEMRHEKIRKISIRDTIFNVGNLSKLHKGL